MNTTMVNSVDKKPTACNFMKERYLGNSGILIRCRMKKKKNKEEKYIKDQQRFIELWRKSISQHGNKI